MNNEPNLESAEAAPLAFGRGKGCVTLKQLKVEMDAAMEHMGMPVPKGQGNGFGWGRQRRRARLLNPYEPAVEA